MEKYIRQLINDIRLAIENAPPVKDEPVDSEASFIEHIEEVEKYLEAPSEKLSVVLGVPLSEFPTEDKLNEQQMDALAGEMIKLMQAYNFYPTFPEDVPAKMLYTALLKQWESEVVFTANSAGIMDICNYDVDDCPFPGYCDVCANVDRDFEEMEDEFYDEDNYRENGIDKPVRTNVDNEGFIPGIYNYCDRWCERCDFTDVCRTFSMEDEFQATAEKRAGRAEGEGDDEAISDDEFLAAFDFDDDDTEEEDGDDIDDSFFNDIDFDIDPDELEDPRKDFFSPHNKAERHPLTVMVDKFMDDSNEWIEVQYKDVEENFTKYVAIGDTDELMEAFDVIMRYHFFVPVKLRRALSGYFEQHEDEFEAFDMNGTAKVMLIAIDDSLLALKVLKRYFKDKKEIIDKLIVQLTEILSQAGGLFPDARSFIRPGLDE
jgi:hypothetical protein